jgi:hypothetical protein
LAISALNGVISRHQHTKGNEMLIITNNHWKELVSWYDLPAKEQPDFDYVKGDDRHSTRFFCYRGCWYDTGEFFVTSGLSQEFHHWHGYQSDSYFSGVLVRYDEWLESVQVATYLI